MISTCSASRALRSLGGRNSMPVAAYSCGVCPAPSPSSNRPPDNRSIVAASHARWTGLRMSVLSTSVPRPIVLVAAATAVIVGIGAGPRPT